MSNDVRFKKDTRFYLTSEQCEIIYNIRDKNVVDIGRRLNLSDNAIFRRLIGKTPVTLREFEVICQTIGIVPGELIRCEVKNQPLIIITEEMA